MIATEAIVDEIRELAMSGGSRALTDLSLTGISLPAAVSLCLSLHLWERKGTPVPGSFCQRAVDLAPLAEAQAVFLGRTGGMLPDDDPFRRTTVEFFPLTCPRAFPSLPWDNYRQRFKKAMTIVGFSPAYALALSEAFHEMADNVVQHSQVGIQTPDFSGLAGYHVSDKRMVFSVGDLGVGVLTSLRSNPRYVDLAASDRALLAVATEQATRRHHQQFGNGFRQVFKSLADLNGRIRLRSGDAELVYGGVSTRTADVGRTVPFPGLEVTVSCGIHEPPVELPM